MKVIFAPAAEVDLCEIGVFIANDNPHRAAAFVQELYAACVSIGDVPLGAAVMPRYAQLGYRRKPYRRYLIIYRVLGERVEIARVLQGSREVERILGYEP